VRIITTALDGLPARVTRDIAMRQRIEAEINDALNRASSRAAKRGAELAATGASGAA
jgi:hypothetical protein